MFDLHMVWAYVDPVTVLPVTSVIATVVGVFMLCEEHLTCRRPMGPAGEAPAPWRHGLERRSF